MSSKPSKRRSSTLSNVHLTKLSPHLQKKIAKPLLKKKSPLFKRISNGLATLGATMTEEGPIPIDEAAEIQETMRSLQPKLDFGETKEGSEEGEFKDQRGNDSKFSTTFGFSHGQIEKSATGGIQLKKQLANKMMTSKGGLDLTKDKKQMQICFSIASKASTMTQNIT